MLQRPQEQGEQPSGVGWVPLRGSERYRDTRARAAVSWLTAALAGGLLLSISQPAAAADKFKPVSSPAASPTAGQKKAPHGCFAKPSLEQEKKAKPGARRQGQRLCRGDMPQHPAEANPKERAGAAPKSDRALWCSTHGTLGFSKPHLPPLCGPLTSHTASYP